MMNLKITVCIILIACTVAFVFISSAKVHGIFEDMRLCAEKEDVAAVSEALDKNRKFLRFFVRNDDIEAIEDSLFRCGSEYGEVKGGALTELKCQIAALEKEWKLSFENVFY